MEITERPTSINDLPDDCLRHIFEGLQTCKDRECFGLTCNRWLQIQNKGRRSLQFHCSFAILSIKPGAQFSTNFDSFHLYQLLNRFQHLNFLSLSGCTELKDSGLSRLQFFGSNLRTLNLDCCFRITDKGLSFVATGCSSLTCISLQRCEITDVGLDTLAKSCQALQDVNLSYCTLVSDLGIRSLSTECRRLRSVTISYCKNITGTGFNGCSQTLAYLEADSCKLQPEGILGVVSGGGLEYLNVSCLRWCILGDGLAGIGSGFAQKLRVLNLRSCRSASNDAIISIAKGCPVLQEWSLALCHEISLPGWQAIGLHCKKLEILHVNRCRNLCDNGLQALREGCKRLLVLYMLRCLRVSHLAIELFKCRRQDVVIKEEDLICVGLGESTWLLSKSSNGTSLGKCVHGQCLKLGLEEDLYVGYSLINTYVKCGEIGAARKVFDVLPVRDVSSWISLIAGYMKNGMIAVAEGLFQKMRKRYILTWTAMIFGYTENSLPD